MEVNSISPASISADKQANIATQAQVAVAKKANEQQEVAGQIVQAAAQSTPEPGKGLKVDTLA